jgi:hypothetical protein
MAFILASQTAFDTSMITAESGIQLMRMPFSFSFFYAARSRRRQMYALSPAIIMLMIALFDHMLCGVPLTFSVDSHRGQMTEVLSQNAVSGFCVQDLAWFLYFLQ